MAMINSVGMLTGRCPSLLHEGVRGYSRCRWKATNVTCDLSRPWAVMSEKSVMNQLSRYEIAICCDERSPV
ncbi:MAG: hypothetical protein QG622_184 [Actinomycetota bacterium]|nr:hypothetical protein [Actinomycetota bacterium]